MNTKKLLSAILSVVMIFSMTTVPVFADDTIVEISTLAELETFRDAVNGGERYKGKTVKLTADIDLESDEWTPIGTSTNPFDGNFDGAGFTISNLKITGTNDYVGLFGKVGTSAESRNEIKNLTLSNVSVSGGKYTAAIAGCGFVVNFTDCTVTGDINVTGNRYTGGIVGHLYGAVKNCSITDTTDDGGAITALYQVGGIVGYTGEGNTVIENCAVNNVAITATSGGWVGGIAGVAHSGSSISNNTISNITVDGGNDSYAISGLIVGQNIGTESSVSYVVNNAIENSSGTVNGETMTNTSGSMGGEPAVSVVGTNVTFDADGKVASGTFEVELPSSTVSEKSNISENEDGTFGVIDTRIIDVDGELYTSLEEAVEAAEDGDTITLLQDVTDGSGIFIGADTKDITIDFGGYTYTVFKPAVGSVGTVTQGFHIEKNNTITLKNGTINTSNPEEVKMLIQNYANLTLQDLTIDYANGLEGRYALSNNCGEVNITGNTGIIAPTNGIAFDVCNSANYPEGVNVTVNTTGEIIGDIELDTKNSELHTLTINNVKHNGAIKLCDGTTSPSVTINGGYFTTDVTDYCAEDKGIAGSVDFDGYGYKVADKADVEDPVAIIGDVVYITFADAVNAAEHDDVIIIKKNSNLTVNLSDSKTFTVKNSLENDIKVNINGTYYLVSAGEEKEIVFTKSSYIAAPGGSVTVSYTVKFETNGGSKIDSVKVKQNKTVSEPTAPVKDGYVFDGWYNDEELKTKYDFDSEVTKSITLYAKWTEEVSDKDEDKDDEKDDSTTEWTNPYSDVAKDAWYYEDVKFATENDLMKGVSEKEFAPNAQLTRAMLVTIIYRNEGEPDVKGSIAFTDVEKGSWYEKAVIWAVENGIVMGVSDDKFAPDVNITREQIATIIFRYANYKKLVLDNNNADISKFADADKISEYAVDAMKYVISAGIINGKTETTLNPGDNATRAEIAAILHRFISLNK